MMFLLLLSCGTSAWPHETVQGTPVGFSSETEVVYVSGEAEPYQEEVRDLRNDILGLEFYMCDKKNYETYCSHIEWEQPSLEVYKRDPRSYLPDDCIVSEE